MRRLLVVLLFLFLVYKFLDMRNFFAANHDSETAVRAAIDGTTNSPDNPKKSFNNLATPATNNSTWFQQFVSNVIVNALQTQVGQNFFGRMIKAQNDNTEILSPISIRNSNFLDHVFHANVTGDDIPSESPAMCGMHANVDYVIKDNDSIVLEVKDCHITIGSGDIKLQAVENLAIGMKIGQIKTGILPKVLDDTKAMDGNDKADNKQTIAITLNKVLDRGIISLEDEIRIFDDHISQVKPFLCGDQVDLKVTIYNLSHNTKVYEEKCNIVLGAADQAYIFNHAAPGSFIGNKRTIITQARFLKTMSGMATPISTDVNLDDKQMILIELE